jgi:hypothetical protein
MSESFAEIINHCDLLYANRERIDSVHEIVELLQKGDGGRVDYELDWRLGRAFFFLGQESQTRSGARKFHAQGITVLKPAVRQRPHGVEGTFWLGVNQALAAQASRSLVSLPYVVSARRSLNRAVKLEESYHGAGPLRALARLSHKTPAWLGGDPALSRSLYERAIAIAPNNTITRIYFAELLMAVGDDNDAREQLEKVLQVPLDAFWAFEIRRDKRIAEQMLRIASVT